MTAPAPAPPAPGPGGGVTFTETMSGRFLVGAGLEPPCPRLRVADVEANPADPLGPGFSYRLEAYGAALAAAGVGARTATSRLTIRLDASSGGQPAVAGSTVLGSTVLGSTVLGGTVSVDGLGAGDLVVEAGRFYLDAADPARVDTRHLLYLLRLVDPTGPARFDWFGFKVLRAGRLRDAWAATTTLYTAVFAEDGGCRAVGIMRVDPRGLAALLRSAGRDGRPPSLGAAAALGRAMAPEVVGLYGGVLAENRRFLPRLAPAGGGATPAGAAEVYVRDGRGRWHSPGAVGADSCARLTRYLPTRDLGRAHPVLAVHGYGMSARSFAWPADPAGAAGEAPAARSLTGHLRARGFEVWLLDHRGSIDLPSSRRPFTIDDIAVDDWPSAVEKVREVTGASVHAFGHCVGSATLLMSLLAGLDGLASACCSQFGTHVRTSAWNVLKADLFVGKALEAMRVRALGTDAAPGWRDVIADLAFLPFPLPAGERCNLALCRWINSVYGLTHAHSQLDQAAHDALPDLFGAAATPGLSQLQMIVRAGHLVDHRGEDIYLAPARRDTLGVPLRLVYGERNFIFHPAGNQETLAWLHRTFPSAAISGVALPDYAHLDAIIGPRAAAEVFPHVAGFFEQAEAG